MTTCMLYSVSIIIYFSMSIRFSSLVSGMALCALLANPVFALSPSSDAYASQETTPADCRDSSLPDYRASLTEAMTTMRNSIMNEWKRQAEVRVNAATTQRRAGVKRALDIAGGQLNAAFDVFVKTQNTSLAADINALVNTYSSDNADVADAVFNGWPNRVVSFRALEAAMVRAENSLRLYTPARDRAAMSRAWNTVRKGAQEQFAAARHGARETFKTDMEACVNGLPLEYLSDDSVSDDSAKDKADQDATPLASTPMSAKVEASLGVEGTSDARTCGAHHFVFVGKIGYGAAGLVKYHWVRSDGQSTATEAVEFAQAGVKTVSFSWDMAATTAQWVRLVIDAPTFAQAEAPITLTQDCAPSVTMPLPNQDTFTAKPPVLPANELVTGVRAQTVSKSEVALCGWYRFQFQGMVDTAGPGTITFRWERSDGVVSPERKVAFDAAGSHEVSAESWDLSGNYEGSVRLHVLSPINKLSETAPLKIMQMCK